MNKLYFHLHLKIMFVYSARSKFARLILIKKSPRHMINSNYLYKKVSECLFINVLFINIHKDGIMGNGFVIAFFKNKTKILQKNGHNANHIFRLIQKINLRSMQIFKAMDAEHVISTFA